MQHFLYENNLYSSIDCFMVGILEGSREIPAPIKNNESVLHFYQNHQQQLKKAGDWLTVHDKHQLFILFSCGPEEKYTPENFKGLLEKMFQLFKQKNISKLLLSLPQVPQLTPKQQLTLSILSIESCCYQFLNYKSEKQVLSLQNVYYNSSETQQTIDEASAIASGIHLCQDLGNTPSNDCKPVDLEHAAINLAKHFPSLKCQVHDEVAMKKLGMNTLLAVGQGSDSPPRLIELHYQHGGNKKPLVLVGKGITFDSGGICLKPSAAMFEMKYDMCGAATVLGVMKAIALLKLPVNVIGILACAENMPSGNATRPGDVIKSFQGLTVEITNTDAEGRLVLADALSYAKKYQPEAMVDIATLTGAIIISLGSVFTGLMTPDDKLAKSLEQAGKRMLDKVWRLPMDTEYEENLNSPVADLMNHHNSTSAGSIVAAHFLNHFTKDYPWAHLDIAGSAWISGKNRQATGRPVALLVDWIANYKHEN
jgi:leucyl aminopeptidase